MPRLMAIDYGTKRTGIAVSDNEQLIAQALTTVDTATLFSFLTTYFAANQVQRVIIGKPLSLQNTATHNTRPVFDFVAKFRTTFPSHPIELLDERFTSKMASQAIAQSGRNKKARQDKALIDQISATILLQDYMQRIL